MNYVYVLKSLKDGNLYIDRTGDLIRRLLEHKNGKVKSTKNRRPLKTVFYEAYLLKEDSIRREHYFKTSKGKSSLRQMLRSSLSI